MLQVRRRDAAQYSFFFSWVRAKAHISSRTRRYSPWGIILVILQHTTLPNPLSLDKSQSFATRYVWSCLSLTTVEVFSSHFQDCRAEIHFMLNLFLKKKYFHTGLQILFTLLEERLCCSETRMTMLWPNCFQPCSSPSEPNRQFCTSWIARTTTPRRVGPVGLITLYAPNNRCQFTFGTLAYIVVLSKEAFGILLGSCIEPQKASTESLVQSSRRESATKLAPLIGHQCCDNTGLDVSVAVDPRHTSHRPSTFDRHFPVRN